MSCAEDMRVWGSSNGYLSKYFEVSRCRWYTGRCLKEDGLLCCPNMYEMESGSKHT